MIPHPIDRYELEKTRQHQVWETAEQDRQVKDAAAEGKRAEGALPRVGALRRVLTLWLNALRKMIPALASRRISSPAKAPAGRCQRSAASAFHHPRLQPTGTQHPHRA
jgi:hypothetical protein